MARGVTCIVTCTISKSCMYDCLCRNSALVTSGKMHGLKVQIPLLNPWWPCSPHCIKMCYWLITSQVMFMIINISHSLTSLRVCCQWSPEAVRSHPVCGLRSQHPHTRVQPPCLQPTWPLHDHHWHDCTDTRCLRVPLLLMMGLQGALSATLSW